jgi:Spy/CpxP family protein refolding chaperone
MTLPASSRLFVATMLLALSAATLSAGSQAQRSAWWKSEELRKELGLTEEQSAQLNRIWEATLPELRQDADELDRHEAKLSRLFESDVNEATLARQVDRVETARANLAKTRALMFVRMRSVLTPEQRKLMQSRFEREMRRSGLPMPRRFPPDGSKPQGADPNKRPDF